LTDNGARQIPQENYLLGIDVGTTGAKAVQAEYSHPSRQVTHAVVL
jgi:sugar (pentulose or hexulose) kinase